MIPADPPQIRDGLLVADLDPNPVQDRIQDLLTMEGNLLVSAYRKCGKSTLIWDLTNALTSPADFLGSLRCAPLPGKLVYVNLELRQNMCRQYAEDTGMDPYNKQVIVQDYRGYSSDFQISNDYFRERYVDFLIAHDADALVIDPISPLMIYSASNSNDTDEARYVMELLGEMAAGAKLKHLIIVDHTGHHDKSRARNSSAKEDWADILWNVQGEDSKPRTLTAMGRGVSGSVSYTINAARRLEVTDKPKPKTVKDRVQNALMEDRWQTSAEIQAETTDKQQAVNDALNELLRTGNAERQPNTRGRGYEWKAPATP